MKYIFHFRSPDRNGKIEIRERTFARARAAFFRIMPDAWLVSQAPDQV